MSNNCQCILCVVGRSVYRSLDSDFAPLQDVIEAIKAYDASLSPYPFSDSDKQAMIAYISKDNTSGLCHFEEMAYFFEERHEAERKKGKVDESQNT